MLFRRRKPAAEGAGPAPKLLSLQKAPDRIYAIGDIHGCFEQLRLLEDKILDHAAGQPGSNLIVVMGDMVDRGPDSAKVIEHFTKPLKGASRVCLRGNHEHMMMRFVDDPQGNADWLKFGGVETLASYGVYLDDPQNPGRDAAARLQALIPQSHLDFINSTAFGLVTPDAIFCHAAFNPKAKIAAQSTQQLLWGNPTKIDYDCLGKDYVHGHIAIDKAEQVGRRINVDSHCYDSGNLSAVCLRPGLPCEFLIASLER